LCFYSQTVSTQFPVENKIVRGDENRLKGRKKTLSQLDTADTNLLEDRC